MVHALDDGLLFACGRFEIHKGIDVCEVVLLLVDGVLDVDCFGHHLGHVALLSLLAEDAV